MTHDRCVGKAMKTDRLGSSWAVAAMVALAAAVAGCDEEPTANGRSYGTWSAEDGPIAAAVFHPERPADDRARNIERKPIEVLRFFGVAPGQAVFEFYAGGGWYSEILARTVGSEGALVLHNNPLFAQYFSEAFEARDLPERFETVSYMPVAPGDLDLAPSRFDRALMILSYHDLLYPPEEDTPIPDRVRLLREIFDGLKPGGVLGVVDHSAPPDVPPRQAGERLHRLDPQLLRYEAETAGFIFDGASRALANPEDDRRKPIFDMERGSTDRFVYRFRKP